MDFKAYVTKKLAELTGLEQETIAGAIEIPPEQKLGDLAFPCFVLAKTLRKAPPMIAAELSEKFEADEWIERAEAVGGYLNFFYRRAAFSKSVLDEIAEKKEKFGMSEIGNGKRVLVEYSSPNIAKPFHIGHLFSTAVGNSLARIYSHLGYETVKINHLGDWGTQFGKLISAYKRWGDRAVIEQDPINELLKIYVKFHEEAEKHPELEDEAREYFKKLEEGDEETTALWQYFRDVSLVEFKRVYDKLDVSFDSYAGESFYSDKMQEVVDLLRDADILTESEGAQVVDLSEDNMPPCIILKSDGATIYATRDIAAALYRHRTYDFHKNIYVVGTPQALHFKQIFASMMKAGWDWAKDCVHVGFGLVKFPDKKLSTRHGDVVFLEDVLNESVQKTLEIIKESNPNLENQEEVAQKVGIGAILYTFLKSSREKDIVFSWDSMLDFDGESGPYVQYTYARGRSILRRVAPAGGAINAEKITSDDEYTLITRLNAFGDAVLDAAEKNEPFYINRYVTNLARAFNKFYNSCPILKDDVDEETRQARLALVEATTCVIQTALSLLGIQTVEEM
ncbi:MAG: arginine--tRNA ligase [Ruminococcaceae bacterium]|nr:arginine--tRNA ligase [Oscillospiraceae bacterium]